jgi:YfiH family protein
MKRPELHYYNLDAQLTAFSSTRHGGVGEGKYSEFNINRYCGDDESHVEANMRALADELGIGTTDIFMPHQVHETVCRNIDADFLSLPHSSQMEALEGVDAVMTQQRGICLGVSTADCIPILLYDKAHHAAAAVHAGWRGTVKRIVAKAVEAMAKNYGSQPAELLAVIGPGISLKNFEVGQVVYDQFADAHFNMNLIAKRFAKWHIDLPRCNELQLLEAGLAKERIFQSGICTFDRVDDFFSARRLGTQSGRIFTGFIVR